MKKLFVFIVLFSVFFLFCSLKLDFDIMPAPENASFAPIISTVSLFPPVERMEVTSPFGYRIHPISNELDFHYGVDFKSAEKSPVYAVQGGVVRVSENHKSYGNYIVIDHYNGFSSLYAHCSKLIKKQGDKVKRGDKIALVGHTGETTGSHLHFEVRLNGVRYDPVCNMVKYALF